jgi:exopolysaccharide biosynthesis polyprenyl glycosylphosphotransferase
MTYREIPLVNFQSDLRSAKTTSLQRGLYIRLLRTLILILFDAISLSLALKLALFYGDMFTSLWANYSYFLLLIFSVELGIIAALGLYGAGDNRRNYFGLFKAVSLASLLLLLIAFLYEPNLYIWRSTFILFWLFSITCISAGRFIFDITTKLVRQKGAVLHSVFLISDVEDEEANIKFIEKNQYFKICGIANASSLDKSNREATFEYLRERRIEEAFVSWNSIKNRLYISWNFYTAGITLRIIPAQTEIITPKFEISMIGELPCMTIPAPIITGSDFWVKRGFDIFGATILLFLLSPLYLLIAVLIKLDSPGSILFKQERIGLHGQKFSMWKFRTMVMNAEQLQAVLEEKNEAKDGIFFKIKQDPRITRIGKFLRGYSLDELPQLFNVLLGDMSFVGPRPLPLRDVEKFKTTHFIRQEVLPGITGLWQVSGRSEIDDFEQVVQLDLRYIQDWSLWLDLQILLKTVKVVLQKKGAY